MGMKRGDLQAADELALVDAALQDDIEAFAELHERYRSDLYALCLRRLSDHSLAEDAVQDIFIRAFKSFPNFDRDRPVWPWFVNIALKACIDIQRRRSFTHYSGDIGVSVDAEGNGHTESPLDEVIASEERAELWKSLDVLPERQRRAFVLYEVDGLSCADIAAAEGVSVGAVKLLLFRARKKMRSVHQVGPLPAIVFPFTWLSWKVQRIEERIRPLLNFLSEGFSNACMQAACLSTLAMMVIAVGHPIESFERSDAILPEGRVLSATQSPLQAASPQTDLANIGVPAKAPVELQQPVANPASSLVDDVVNPNQNATPENTQFTSIVVSPNYQSDRTILASGYRRDEGGNVLFVSHNGGASWKPQPSRLFSGYAVAVPPGYPQDRRIFALGDLGLQQSDDLGENFRPVSPFSGKILAISPSFGREDSKVLMANETLFEYDADTGVTRPGLLGIPPSRWGAYHYAAFSPGYSSDPTVFVTDNYSRGDGIIPRFDQSTLYRCKGGVCEEEQFSNSGLTLRLSPRFAQDGLAYAFTYDRLLFSNDGARTFREIQLPVQEFIQDVAISWDTFSGPAIFISNTETRPSISRSFDAGRSWSRTQVDLPGFYYGANKLSVTPTGRLLTAGSGSSIACSEDKGQTWRPRCTPE